METKTLRLAWIKLYGGLSWRLDCLEVMQIVTYAGGYMRTTNALTVLVSL